MVKIAICDNDIVLTCIEYNCSYIGCSMEIQRAF